MLKNSSQKATTQDSPECGHCPSELAEIHPDHARSVNRIRRIRGQLDGVERMIQDRRYCPEVLMQIKAAASALKGLEAEVLERHIRACVTGAVRSKDKADIETKISELLTLFLRKH